MNRIKGSKVLLRTLIAIGIIVVFMIGMSAGGGTPEAKTVTVEKTVASGDCLNALGYADQAHETAGETFLVFGDAVQQAANQDLAGLTASNSKIKELTPDLKAQMDMYRAAAAKCRAAK